MNWLQIILTYLVSGVLVYFGGWLIQGEKKKPLRELFEDIIRVSVFIGLVVIWPILFIAIIVTNEWLVIKLNQFWKWFDKLTTKKISCWLLFLFLLVG